MHTAWHLEGLHSFRGRALRHRHHLRRWSRRVQTDLKKLVAYSSVSHLGFCVLGLAFSRVPIGYPKDRVLYMINHGLSTGALFLVIGMIYERYHTRDIAELSGLAKRMPVLAFFLDSSSLPSPASGSPGSNGFVSEFLTIQGAFISDHLGIGYASFAALGVILGARLYAPHGCPRDLGTAQNPRYA